jgi:hypothetical protein
MEIISNYSNGNYEAQVSKSFDNHYEVTYSINGKPIKKTRHISQDLAEDLAEDFILDGGGYDPQFLSD